MPTLTPERTVEEVLAGWRSGADEEGPAGSLFTGGYVEYEITMTGGGGSFPGCCSDFSMSVNPVTGETYYCC